MLTFARAFGADLAAGVSLARGRYLATLRPILVISAFSVLSSYTGVRRISGLLALLLDIGYLIAWAVATRAVYVAYTRPAPERGENAVDLWTTVKQLWTVCWPLLGLVVLWYVALRIAIPIPGAAAVVLYAGIVLMMAASMVAGWAYTFVVTDGVDAKTARGRAYRSISNRRVLATALAAGLVIAVLWNASLYVTELAAAAVTHRSLTALFPHPPGTPFEAAFQFGLNLIYWPFLYALVLVTRPRFDVATPPSTQAAPPRRRGEISLPGWLDWARRLFRDPPNRAG